MSDTYWPTTQSAVIRIIWDARRKCYIAYASVGADLAGRRVSKIDLENDLHPELDGAAMKMLLIAMAREYASWVL